MKIINSIILLCFGIILQAQSPVLVDNNTIENIGKSLVFFVDTTNALSLAEIKKENFQDCETDVLNLGNIPHALWIHFKVVSQEEKTVYLQISAPLLEELEVYEEYDSSSNKLFQGGFPNNFKDRPIDNKNWLFTIETPPGIEKDIYIKARSGYTMLLPISLSSKDRHAEFNMLHHLFWGLYIGVMLFAFIYNIFIYFSLRERTYLYYVSYIGLSVLFYLGLQGFDYMFLWPKAGYLNAYIPMIVCLTNVMIGLFTLRFLGITREKDKIIYYIVLGFMGIFSLLFVMNLFLPYAIVDGLAQLVSLPMSLYFIFIGAYYSLKGVPSAKYFLLAWTLFLISVIIFILSLNNVVPSNFLTSNSIFIGHMTEVLLLSFSLANRINWLKKENESKQELIISQLQENDKIKTEANKNLEIKVAERTAEVVEQKNEAIRQKERSDELLLNILPESTAEELKATGMAKSNLLDEITVMFTDVENFSSFAETMDSTELVKELNETFSAFDEIMVRFNLEKIKTIGDSYMAAGGLPEPNKTHATDILDAAFEIQRYMENRHQEQAEKGKIAFRIRLGIHTGPVVAGVVGVKKFAYDIWGKTVNIASRMERNGEPGKINISETTYQLIKDKYNVTHRGKIEAKGVGNIDMYFVDNKK